MFGNFIYQVDVCVALTIENNNNHKHRKTRSGAFEWKKQPMVGRSVGEVIYLKRLWTISPRLNWRAHLQNVFSYSKYIAQATELFDGTVHLSPNPVDLELHHVLARGVVDRHPASVLFKRKNAPEMVKIRRRQRYTATVNGERYSLKSARDSKQHISYMIRMYSQTAKTKNSYRGETRWHPHAKICQLTCGHPLTSPHLASRKHDNSKPRHGGGRENKYSNRSLSVSCTGRGGRDRWVCLAQRLYSRARFKRKKTRKSTEGKDFPEEAD